jgi:hypothetical protein
VATDRLIDDIYEAAIVPEKWQSVLDRLAQMADAEGSLLFAAGPGTPRWLSSQSIQDAIEEWTKSKWFLDNPRGQRLVPIDEPRFLTDLDALTMEEVDASDYYTELLRPRGLGWCVGTSVRAPSGDTLVLSIEKAHRKGPVHRGQIHRTDFVGNRNRPEYDSNAFEIGLPENRSATAGRAGQPARRRDQSGHVESSP